MITAVVNRAQVLRAALFMLGAMLGFSSMAVAARELVAGLDTFEIMAYRSVISLAIVLIVAVALGRLPQLRPVALDLHLGRNLFHFTGQNLWIFAFAYLPLAQVFAFEFSYPILVAIGAALFLGEKFTPLRALTSVIGFCGILLVAGVMQIGESGLQIDIPRDVEILGLLAAGFCAVGFAGSALFTKALTRRAHVSVLNVMFWMASLQLIMGFACAGFDGEMSWPLRTQMPWLFVMGLGGLIAHGCLTAALSIAPATIVTPFDFLRLPMISVVGWLLYKEVLSFEIGLGALIIFAANYVNILFDRQIAKDK